MIRPATIADADQIAALMNPWIRDSTITFTSVEKTPADIARMIKDRKRDGHAMLVAEADGLLGYAPMHSFALGRAMPPAWNTASS